MKKAIFIVIVIMLLKPVMPVLDYVINYDYIAKELCENKTKPQMHCNGKCHLMKELAKAAEEQKQESDRKSAQENAEVLFFQAPVEFAFSPVIAIPYSKNETVYCNLYSHSNTVSFFHPPVFIS
ncbi:hypothetical protein [Flavobacterium sp. AG291]|uniref:hypothetical protein n=1 Tax=Flavobacterium sp. AG291 TaxID=2184000 RepID=UPI001F33FFBD|nr:hypothetical protein [Flavobacterium sp. AG291]